MRVLWLNWKDPAHPAAGGAEVVLWELSKRLVQEGNEVTILTCGFAGAKSQENVEGINIIRIGANRYAHSMQALMHYIRQLRNKFDIVIEMVNTAPYFGVFFGKQSKRFLFYHQLAEEIWFHETKPPLSHFGRYILEPTATRIMAHANVPVITVSNSTLRNLQDYGFKPGNVHVISEGLQMEPVENLEPIEKFSMPTMLSLGALRAMKRTLDQIKAFEIAKEKIPNLQLKIAGSSDDPYAKKVLEVVDRSPYKDSVEYLGRVSPADKIELMRRSHLITVTSIKEGWGLIVTEAASQGTPAVVYDVDGLRDSVRHGETGIITSPSPTDLAAGIVNLLSNPESYERFRSNGWAWSRSITFDQSYNDLKSVLETA
jgi:glycosyltransferase involved in cell wall biosynthesis